jgi:alpha-glucosidase (family GH31 glycosyl hydrolase)
VSGDGCAGAGPVGSERRVGRDDEAGNWSAEAASVRRSYDCSPTDKLPQKKEFVVNRQWTPVPFEWREESARFVLRTARMGVQVDRTTGALTFVDAAGQMLLQEPSNGGRTITEADPNAAVDANQVKSYRVQQTFLSPDDEHLYGMAECQDGVWNWRGMPIELRQLNTQAALPEPPTHGFSVRLGRL